MGALKNAFLFEGLPHFCNLNATCAELIRWGSCGSRAVRRRCLQVCELVETPIADQSIERPAPWLRKPIARRLRETRAMFRVCDFANRHAIPLRVVVSADRASALRASRARIRNDTAGCVFRWAPIPDATEPASQP
jgi:hypothetical protein